MSLDRRRLLIGTAAVALPSTLPPLVRMPFLERWRQVSEVFMPQLFIGDAVTVFEFAEPQNPSLWEVSWDRK